VSNRIGTSSMEPAAAAHADVGRSSPDSELVECSFCARYAPPSFDPEQAEWVYASGRWVCPLHGAALRKIGELLPGGGSYAIWEGWSGGQLEEAAALAGSLVTVFLSVEVREAAWLVARLDDGQELEEPLGTEPEPFLCALRRLEWRARILVSSL
jgi:hypothetical protein